VKETTMAERKGYGARGGAQQGGAPRDVQAARSASDEAARAEDRAVEEIVSRGPTGAFAVAGVATAIVVAIFVLFYVFVYFPRGAVQ
jgi:hypothetical protein